MKEREESEVVSDFKRIAKKMGRTPSSFSEYLAHGGKCKEWEFRKLNGFDGVLKLAGFDPASVTILKLRSENQRLAALIKATEKMALSSEKIRELIEGINFDALNPDNEWMKGAKKPRAVHGIGIIMLSDLHFDEVVRPEQIGHCNAYNREIATKRIKNVFKNSVKLLKGYMASPKYDGIVCNLGGDLLSGNIHEELVESNEACINQSILVLAELLIEGIGGLADEFGKVFVPCVTGNHGRMHKKPRAKNRAFENFEWLIYQYLARYFKNDSRISFEIPDGSDGLYKVYDRSYCLTHGDQFRGGDGIGGIMVPIMRGASKKLVRQQAIGAPFDVIMMGHWHQYIHMDRLVINGSVKGYDEYAFQNNFPFEPPQQALWIEHPEDRMTFRMPILCDKS